MAKKTLIRRTEDAFASSDGSHPTSTAAIIDQLIQFNVYPGLPVLVQTRLVDSKVKAKRCTGGNRQKKD